MNHAKCAQCDTEIFEESITDEFNDRKPCPSCGSTARKISEMATCEMRISSSASASVVSYPDTLLTMAQGLIDNRQFGIAVVVCHMACEVTTERALSAAFDKKQIQYLQDSVLTLLNGFNLSNERNRKLYTALTGDDIEKQSFWQDFKHSATRRNEVIHKGKQVTLRDASETIKSARAFIQHVHP